MYIFQFSYKTEDVLILAENEREAIKLANNRLDYDFDIKPQIECLGSIDCIDIIARFSKNIRL